MESSIDKHRKCIRVLYLPASRKPAVVADRAAAFVFYRAAAFGTCAHKHDYIVTVPVALAAFYAVFFEGPCNGVRAGEYPAAFMPDG